MQFCYLEDICNTWKDILVIGKTIERDGDKYHIVGMTLAQEARLYIIEPERDREHTAYRKMSNGNMRRQMKAQNGQQCGERDSYLHCREFRIGNRVLRVQGGSGGSLSYSAQNYGEIQLFMDMMRAGWKVPEWLKNMEWEEVQLITLHMADVKRLPKYSADMPIVITHTPNPVTCLLEKTLTLEVGKDKAFTFTDQEGDKVQCYINDVRLMDVWEEAEEKFKMQLQNPKYRDRFSAEQIEEIKEHTYAALEQNCPRGMCYLGIEYECSKDYSLQFYSKAYLKSYPTTGNGSASFLMMHLKPDKKKGTHDLPLRGAVIQTPLSPDTVKVPAEVFSYTKMVKAWEERV